MDSFTTTCNKCGSIDVIIKGYFELNALTHVVMKCNECGNSIGINI